MPYDVILTDVGPAKLGVVKTIIDLTGNGLKDAKDLADAVSPGKNKVVLKRVETLEEAAAMKTALINSGAVVEIVNSSYLHLQGTATNFIDLNFKVLSTGTIIQYTTHAQGIVAGGFSGVGIEDKTFRINYRSKNGEDKTEVVQATSLEEAKSKIEDLGYVNYHMGG